jgi:methionyl-tRNA formyltransferase
VWRKLILRKRVYKCERNDQYTASGFLKTHDISYVPIPEICRRSTIPVIWTNDFNNDSFVRQIFNIQPDIIVFTGGGLIRKQLLDIAPLGVLNAHSGILPEYRGMDVPEWAILQGDLQGLGVTIHIMDAGIDTGPILSTHPLRLKPGDDIKRLRDRIDYLLSEAMIETTCDYLAERISPRPQRVEDGRQYFVMDPLLIELTATKLSRTS